MIKPLLVKILNGTLDPATRLAESVLCRLRRLPPDAPVRMTPTNLAWDDYLRRRDGRRPRDFAALRAPGVSGLVSVVLPVFNGQRYLAESIESVLAQTWRDFELIVVDDGSTDQTPEIADAHARRDGRIRVIHQQNARLPGALNAGLAVARGEFFTWTSDDCRLRPEYLEKMAAALAADPRTDMIYADYDLIDEDGRLLRNSEVCACLQEPRGSGQIHLLRDISILNLINGNYIGPAFLCRVRALFLIGLFSPRRFTCEDYDFHLRVNEQLRLRHTPFDDGLFEYRIHGDSLTARKEDLGIDRKTEALMAFDDFRRDFVFHPLAWTIQVDPRGGLGAAALARRLVQCIHQADELNMIPGQWPKASLPQAWFPAVYVYITQRLPESSAELEALDLPAGTLSFLVYTGTEPLPEKGEGRWDGCFAFSDTLVPARLERPRQGWLAAGEIEVLWRALGVRARSDHAARLEDLAARPASLRVSVVISTTGRREKLGAAVRSALRQSLAAEDYEVIVVDNMNTMDNMDGLQSLIEELRKEERGALPDCLRLVRCPLRGMSIARNAGLVEARGRVVHFLDDDALAASDLLERLVRAHEENPGCAVVGGAISLKEPDPWPSWFAKRAKKFWGNFEPAPGPLVFAEDWREFPWGGNWSVKRDAFLEIGGFRCRYGRAGRQFNTGEEVVASLMLHRLGHRIAIDPEARVIHDVDPARFTLRNLVRTVFETWDLALPLELDFYLERPARWPRLLWLGMKHLRHAAYALRKDRFEALENLIFAVANIRLAARQLALELRRWRVPRQERKS